MKLARADLNSVKKIQNLYEKAFPKEEKKPFELILQKSAEGCVEILSVEDDKEFIGLSIAAIYKNLCLLDYFAIDETKRGLGFGGAAFNLIKERYKDKKFFLEIENTAIDAENKIQRIKRKNFYLKNGMQKLPFIVNLIGVEMEILSDGSLINFEEYHKLYTEIFGSSIGEKITLLNYN